MKIDIGLAISCGGISQLWMLYAIGKIDLQFATCASIGCIVGGVIVSIFFRLIESRRD